MTRAAAISAVLTAMAALALLNVLVKALPSEVSIATIMLAQNGVIAVAMALWLRRWPRLTAMQYLSLLPRVVLTLIGVFCFLTALRRAPVTSVVAVLYLYPVLMAGLVSIVNRLAFSWRVWAAILGGLCAMALVVQPSGWHPALGLAAVTALCVSLRGAVDRHVIRTSIPASDVQLVSSTALVGLLSAALLSGVASTPATAIPTGALILLAGIGALALLAQCLILRVLSSAHVAAYPVFSYWEIAFTALLGASFLGEALNGWQTLGIALFLALGFVARDTESIPKS